MPPSLTAQFQPDPTPVTDRHMTDPHGPRITSHEDARAVRELRAHLVVIRETQLFSPQTDGALAGCIAELDRKLEEWDAS